MLNWWTSKFQSNRILSSTLSPPLPLHMRSPPKIVEPFGCLPSWLDIPRIVAGTNTAPNWLLDLFRPGLVRLYERLWVFDDLPVVLCYGSFLFLQWRAHDWVVCDRVRLTSPCALLAVTPCHQHATATSLSISDRTNWWSPYQDRRPSSSNPGKSWDRTGRTNWRWLIRASSNHTIWFKWKTRKANSFFLENRRGVPLL